MLCDGDPATRRGRAGSGQTGDEVNAVLSGGCFGLVSASPCGSISKTVRHKVLATN